MFRRVIAGLILGPALLIGSFAWAGFLALRTVFDEDRSRDVAEELLDNDAVREQLASNLASAIESAAPAGIELPGDDVDRAATVVLNDPRVETLILDSLGETHRAFLGVGEAPQEIDLGPVLATARDQIADFAPAIADQLPEQFIVELPTERIPDASPLKDVLEAAVPLLAAIAVALALMALLTTSDRPSVLRRAARWAIGSTIAYLIIGLGIPYLLRVLAPDQAEVVAALLAALLRTTLVPSIVLGASGALLFTAAIFWPDRGRTREVVPVREPVAARSRSVAPAATPAPPPHSDRLAASNDPTTATGLRSRADRAEAPGAAPRPPSQPVQDRVARRPERSVDPPPPPRPTLPTRAKRPDGADPAASTGERQDVPRQPKWLPPTWVEGHGWVMDPADPREPPSNARLVEGVGWVVPGPPPDTPS